MQYSKCVSKYLILLNFCYLAACQSSDYSNPVPGNSVTQPAPQKPVYESVAEGAINGRAWQFSSGAARVFKRKGRYLVEVKLWNQVYGDPCKESSGSTFQVRLYADNKVGGGSIDPSDPFTLIPMIVFSDFTDSSTYRNNMVASKGQIHVDSLGEGRVVGTLEGNFTAGSVGRTEVSGKFDVPLCQQKSGSD